MGVLNRLLRRESAAWTFAPPRGAASFEVGARVVQKGMWLWILIVNGFSAGFGTGFGSG
jgi:hypothetical protein